MKQVKSKNKSMADERLGDSLRLAPLTLGLMKERCVRSLDRRFPTDSDLQ